VKNTASLPMASRKTPLRMEDLHTTLYSRAVKSGGFFWRAIGNDGLFSQCYAPLAEFMPGNTVSPPPLPIPYRSITDSGSVRNIPCSRATLCTRKPSTDTHGMALTFSIRTSVMQGRCGHPLLGVSDLVSVQFNRKKCSGMRWPRPTVHGPKVRHGSPLCRSGSPWGRLGVALGSPWGRYGVALGSPWSRLGVAWVPIGVPGCDGRGTQSRWVHGPTSPASKAAVQGPSAPASRAAAAMGHLCAAWGRLGVAFVPLGVALGSPGSPLPPRHGVAWGCLGIPWGCLGIALGCTWKAWAFGPCIAVSWAYDRCAGANGLRPTSCVNTPQKIVWRSVQQ
jgi:hypothetical protein